mmetsp:Transcript_9496/g.26512  ORF Transcript_9496/g.26512 Transcript_9496/m.26512 type:complete len:201 (+) Transcript_9496:152-754(+)
MIVRARRVSPSDRTHSSPEVCPGTSSPTFLFTTLSSRRRSSMNTIATPDTTMNTVVPSSPCAHMCLPVPIVRTTPSAATLASSAAVNLRKNGCRARSARDSSSSMTGNFSFDCNVSFTDFTVLGMSSPGKGRPCRSRMEASSRPARSIVASGAGSSSTGEFWSASLLDANVFATVGTNDSTFRKMGPMAFGDSVISVAPR